MTSRRDLLAGCGVALALIVVVVLIRVATAGDEPPSGRDPARSSPVSSPGTDVAGAVVTAEAPELPVAEPFTPAAYDGWLTAIPAGFPLAAGLPAGKGDVTRSERPVTAAFCGAKAFPRGVEVAVRHVVASGPEHLDGRDLRLFRDDRAAHRFLARAAALARRCPVEEHGRTTRRHDARVSSYGEESVLLVTSYELDGLPVPGATIWQVTRAGNAVLLAVVSGEYLPGETLGSGIRDHQARLQPVVTGLCAFTPGGC